MSIKAYPIAPPTKEIEPEQPSQNGHECALELRRLETASGAIQYRRQCVICGQSSNAIAHDKLSADEKANAADYDPELSDRYYQEQHWQRVESNEQKRRRAHAAWLAWYDQYLQSPIWQERRELVLLRAGGICEACRLRRASAVHHLTYARVGKEPLFDLVAVCKECHDELHKEVTHEHLS